MSRFKPTATLRPPERALRTDFGVPAACAAAQPTDTQQCGILEKLALTLGVGMATFAIGDVFLAQKGVSPAEMFAQADTDGNNQVDRSEFNLFLQQIQPGVGELGVDAWNALTRSTGVLTQADFEEKPDLDKIGESNDSTDRMNVWWLAPYEHDWEALHTAEEAKQKRIKRFLQISPSEARWADQMFRNRNRWLSAKTFREWGRTQVDLINHVLKHDISRQYHDALVRDPDQASDALVKIILERNRRQRQLAAQLMSSPALSTNQHTEAWIESYRAAYMDIRTRAALPLVGAFMLAVFVVLARAKRQHDEANEAVDEARRREIAGRARRARRRAGRANDEVLARAERGIAAAERAKREKEKIVTDLKNGHPFKEKTMQRLVSANNTAAFRQLKISLASAEAILYYNSGDASGDCAKAYKRAKEKAEQDVVTCPICLKPFSDAAVPGEVFKDGEIAVNELLMRSFCGHIFCKDCARQNQAFRTQCPMCNTEPMFTLDDGLHR